MDDDGNFIKEPDKGMDDVVWQQMLAYAKDRGLTGGNFKKLNAPFENRLLAQSGDIRDRMARGVETFVYTLLTQVFNATDTADIVLSHILDTRSHDPGVKSGTIESLEAWTEEKIREKAAVIGSDKGPEGDFDD
jgi:hypothetical protein